MTSQTGLQSDAQAQLAMSLLHELLKDYHPRDFAVRFWDGTTWEAESSSPTHCTLVVRQPAALRALMGAGGEFGLGEAYLADDWDIEGAGEALVPLADYLFRHIQSQQGQSTNLELLRTSDATDHPHVEEKKAHLHGGQHSRARDREVIAYHYDLSNQFYSLWLDRQMVYSCAYFASSEDDLDTAQARKLDYVCRKLRLRPGQRLLDIGCGWGGLLIHAARHYGVEAFGVTLSHEQAQWATEQINAAGLSQCCKVQECDYREVNTPEPYDAIASVGMVEHVGAGQLSTYFAQAWRLLRPCGVFLNHGIGCPPAHCQQQGRSFVDQYVFPDAEIVPISTLLRAAEGAGFEVRDLENLREHYALTVRHWLRGIERHHDAICRLTNEVAYRIWRISAIGSIYRFLTGDQNLYQTLLVKPEHGKSDLPLTRKDWYS